jgi:hypothetical protein
MKKIFGLMLLCAASMLYSCEKEYIPQEVELSLDYTFIESGNMSRATGSEVYADFYNKYIETKVLTPKKYELTFDNNETKATTTINGNWDRKDGIRLLEGSYTVVGSSRPVVKYEFSDSLFLSFNEVVDIKKDDTDLLLTALHDSFLLMFDVDNTAKIDLKTTVLSSGSPEKQVIKDDKLYWIFLQDVVSSFGSNYFYTLKIYRKDGNNSNVVLKNMPFEKGKYYYFNDLTNSFNIPPMESGN